MHDWNCRLADFPGLVLEPVLTAEAMHLLDPDVFWVPHTHTMRTMKTRVDAFDVVKRKITAGGMLDLKNHVTLGYDSDK